MGEANLPTSAELRSRLDRVTRAELAKQAAYRHPNQPRKRLVIPICAARPIRRDARLSDRSQSHRGKRREATDACCPCPCRAGLARPHQSYRGGPHDQRPVSTSPVTSSAGAVGTSTLVRSDTVPLSCWWCATTGPPGLTSSSSRSTPSMSATQPARPADVAPGDRLRKPIWQASGSRRPLPLDPLRWAARHCFPSAR